MIKPKIDSWDRDGGRCVIMPKYLDLWSMENLVAILETIGSVKQLQISMISELSAEAKMTREKKMKIFKVIYKGLLSTVSIHEPIFGIISYRKPCNFEPFC